MTINDRPSLYLHFFKRFTMAKTPQNSNIMYQLQGGGIHITYAATSKTGKPLFTYQDANGSKTFTDKEIDVVTTPIGKLVTVRHLIIVDSDSTTFSVLIPEVNLRGADKHADIHTDGITTIHRDSFAGT
jgi:hypothetical protein